MFILVNILFVFMLFVIKFFLILQKVKDVGQHWLKKIAGKENNGSRSFGKGSFISSRTEHHSIFLQTINNPDVIDYYWK